MKRGTLQLGGSTIVFGQSCKLKIASSRGKHLTIRCEGSRNAKSSSSTPGIVHLNATEELRLTANRCTLSTAFVSSRQFTVRCSKARVDPTPNPSVEPSAQPTSEPTVEPSLEPSFEPTVTPTSTPTNSPTPTSTPTPIPTASISVSPGTLSLTANGSAGSLTVTNDSGSLTALNILASLPAAWTDVTQDASNCLSLSPGNSCTLNFTPGGAAHVQEMITIQGSNTTAVQAQITVVPAPTTLSISLSQLALSVTGRNLDGNSSGTARTIQITNTGALAATGLSINFPTFPSGTSASTTCGATLAPSASCSIMITPGATSTSNCATGIPVVPGAIVVSADNASSVSTNLVVLDYGCIFQEGFVFAMDESPSTSQSIGGKVVALSDQVPPGPPYIVWSSDGSDAISGHGSYDLIPGIDQSSISSAGAPTFADFSTDFSNKYTNVLGLNSSSFSACDGNSDGSCNTSNILAFYNMYQTNYEISGTPPYTATVAPTQLSYYAAGVCADYNGGGYSDWYLPAICEMGYDAASNGSGCGTLGSPTQQNIEVNLVANALGSLPPFFYWSSTEYTLLAGQEAQHAWAQLFVDPVGNPQQQSADKDSGTAGVRCVRALTP